LAFAWVGYTHFTEHFSQGTWFAEQGASFEKALWRDKLLCNTRFSQQKGQVLNPFSGKMRHEI